MTIHATAIISPEAKIDPSVTIGAYTVVDGPVTIGAETNIGAHVVISGKTTIGARNKISSFASIGAPPQDIHYNGEETEVIIGDDNQIREYVSINRATTKADRKTIIGNSCMIMAYCHIAHDCVLGNNVIMANVATLAGHVEIGNNANLGGLVAVHQFCRIGDYTYVGGMSGIGLDVPPYVILEGIRNQMRIAGINKIGLRRAGFDKETIKKLDDAFRLLFRSPQLLTKDALAQIEEEMGDCAELKKLADFFHSTKRGVVKRTIDD